MKLQIKIPPKLIPVFMGEADVRGAYGGRGSGKTRSFAKMACVRAVMLSQAGKTGIILCCRQFMNSLDESSLEELKEAIRSEPELEPYFEVGEKYIKTKDGRIQFKFSGLDRNIDSIKSKSKILICWVDEAEAVLELAWIKLIPTIREEGSELWVTWNPERKGSATDKRFRETVDPRYKVVEMNYRDNPKFPEKLDRERLRDKENNPDDYAWIWEGGYRTAMTGAYFTKHLAKAREEGRLSDKDNKVIIPEDPLMTVHIIVDIGGTGSKSDNFVMWAEQWIGERINSINYYESQGQPIGSHLDWLRTEGYTPERAKIWLPHDGDTNDKVHDISYASAFRQAGYKVEVIPNQGRGAAKQRIERMRNLFSRMYFDEKCKPGVEALAWYHEKRDEARDIGLGPEHDFSSHAADAKGLGAIAWQPPKIKTKVKKIPKIGGVA